VKLLLPFNLWLAEREKGSAAETLPNQLRRQSRAAGSKKFFLPEQISGRFSEKSIGYKRNKIFAFGTRVSV